MKVNKKILTIAYLLIQLQIVGCKSQDLTNTPTKSLGTQPISNNSSTVKPQNLRIKSLDEIKSIANKFTIKIAMKVGDVEVNGNGIIFDIQGENHYVLTTNHIFSSRTKNMKIDNPTEDDLRNINNNEKLEITTSDGKSYIVDTETITQLPNNLDLAYFKFSSTAKSYEKASFTNKNDLGETVYIYGYKKCNKLKTNDDLEFNSGFIQKLPEDKKLIDGGYSLFYSNSAIATMSGSPIINMKGEVIAIHGKATRDKGKISKPFLETCKYLAPYFGDNYGIPVNKFINDSGKIMGY